MVFMKSERLLIHELCLIDFLAVLVFDQYVDTMVYIPAQLI